MGSVRDNKKMRVGKDKIWDPLASYSMNLRSQVISLGQNTRFGSLLLEHECLPIRV